MIRLNVKAQPVILGVRQEKLSLAVAPATLVHVGGDPYEGAYEITPTVEGFTLPTAQKTMKDDLMVKKIPFFETSNTAGGETVYIAADINE